MLMNSETPNSESDKIIFEPSASDTSARDESTEATFDPDRDIWLSDSAAEVTAEPEPESEPELSTPIDLNETEDKAIEPEPEPESEPELFVDTWLDEPQATTDSVEKSASANSEIDRLEQQKVGLQQEIAELKAQKEQVLLRQVREAQENMGRIIEEGTKELIERKAALRIEIDKLERRKERIDREMRSSFAGSSKELAIKVQGFKEYLVGSLQDLASAAEKLELTQTQPVSRNREKVNREPRREGREGRERLPRNNREDSNRPRNRRNSEGGRSTSGNSNARGFTEPTFADQSRRIRQLLDKYCNTPDYYGSPWQLRRTFEQSQAKKVQEWFFSQGGRGAVDSMGSRLQNILVASAAISILHDLYRDRTQFLVLTDTPENLGEWRRGLEDCLGISRRDFGTNRGIVLFDSPDVLVQRAERLIADKLLPVIIIDETEDLLNLSMLKFPIWLAFASSNKSSSANYLY